MTKESKEYIPVPPYFWGAWKTLTREWKNEFGKKHV
jgi:hypothetical protein